MLFLLLIVKCRRKERHWKRIVSKKEAELEDLESAQPIHITENEMDFGKNTKEDRDRNK